MLFGLVDPSSTSYLYSAALDPQIKCTNFHEGLDGLPSRHQRKWNNKSASRLDHNA